jgi:DNA invertase Pin-like site-specific DNA recombinase
MKFFAYLRVSTDEQASSGAGLAAQEDACGRHAKAQGGTLAGIFADEGVSGAASLEKRPALLECLSKLGKDDVLLVAKRDRLGRDPLIVALIEASVRRKGAKIASVAGEGTDGDQPTDILMRRIVDAFAEYERLVIGARTRAALQAKKSRGQRVGHIPFGMRLAADGIHLEPDPLEQSIIAEIARLQRAGLSLAKIATDLNGRGVFNRDGRRWNQVTVWNASKKAAS